MNKEDNIRFAGLMEDYLNIPSFVCEMIQQQLEENKYKEVVEYVVQRRNEIESKEDYISYQQAINMWIKKLEEKDKEIERLNNIIKSIKEELKVYIDITIDHLETNNEEINFELRNKCRAMREIKEELLNIIEKELKEGKE